MPRKKNQHPSPPPHYHHPHYNLVTIMPPPLPEEGEVAGQQQQQLEPIKEEPQQEEEELEDLTTVPQIKKGNKKKPWTEKQRSHAQHNLSLLLQQNFHPVPFSSSSKRKHLDHEPLLRALGLWDFATIDFPSADAELRTDLLAHLVSSYDPSLRRSFVRDAPLSFSRYALAKSLNLPLEMHTSADSETKLFSDEKSITAIEEFMATYILLEDDISILPEEAKVVIGMVKEGRAGEVDWADLMWVLVEKEVLDALRTGRCRYGPHLQRLIQCQRPELLLGEGESVIVPEAESDWSMKISDSVVEEEDKVEEGEEEEEEEEKGIEECGTGLSLGLGEKYDAAPPPPEEEKGFEQHCLRRCESIGNERGMEFENLSQGDEKRREEEFENLERLTSADLLHGMETVRVSYDHQINRLEPGNREFLATGVNAGKDIATDTSPGGSLFFGNNGKRHASDDADSDENDQLKRMRTGGLWGEQTPPSNFDSFMEQIQCTVGRAKLIYDEKDQACMNANMEIQYLAEMLEEKDQIIQTLEKTRVDEQQKWQQTVCSYESELNLVADLMLGYKKALKQIERNFTKYRKKFPQGDEPVYRDVPGEGGLVLSARELEKRRLEKEFEMRRIAEEMANDFHASWFAKFEACTDGVLVLQERLVGLDAEIDLLKKRFVETKNNQILG
ncbi:uncharacterized protein M6B38_102790 [Iris pallida]|uniref:Uncharacterized protein n=1 Tax=Iris pallida TaxID=29817 RepID=A0AAX6G7H9_IRIPA|nr:uncharacterized protein M6B38_102790 [Iris pallida]